MNRFFTYATLGGWFSGIYLALETIWRLTASFWGYNRIETIPKLLVAPIALVSILIQVLFGFILSVLNWPAIFVLQKMGYQNLFMEKGFIPDWGELAIVKTSVLIFSVVLWFMIGILVKLIYSKIKGA